MLLKAPRLHGPKSVPFIAKTKFVSPVQVLADLRGTPERADWRACKLTSQEETEMAEAFKEMFKPFDIMET
jgi:hypothetical protein